MKKLFTCLLLFLLLAPLSVFANGAGLPAFFKINDKLAVSNQLQAFGITSQSFLIPQDFAPENYVVNQPIDFEIDVTQLQSVLTNEYIKNTKFSWDYGDGNKAEGRKNTHSYKKIGSYILVLTINVYIDRNQPPTQFIDSFLINILPSKDYKQLPQAVIRINSTQVKDPIQNLIEVNLNENSVFDATDSKAPSSQIVQYLWNFGDGQTSSLPIATHKYDDQSFKTVVLRIKDKNGFISDAFAGLRDNPSVTNNIPVSKESRDNAGKYILLIIGIVIIILITFYVIRKRNN